MLAPLQSWLEMPDGHRFDLTGTITIGRSPDNALVLQDDQVSRKHAIIQVQGEREFWLVDLGSANGTYINGLRIDKPQQLHRGDVIQMAETTLEFHSEMLTGMHPMGRQLMASTRMSIKQTNCWLMIADIIGSTKLAQELPLEEFPRVTGTWFRACRQIVEDCKGQVSKYLGDGFFCYWRDAKGSDAGVRDAVMQLRRMQANSSPPFRVVLHYGPAVVGSVPTMTETNLHGPEVNFAFRIEKIAAKLHSVMMLSERAHERLGLGGSQIGESDVEGFNGKFRFFDSADLA
jgi:adenylate cyclase